VGKCPRIHILGRVTGEKVLLSKLCQSTTVLQQVTRPEQSNSLKSFLQEAAGVTSLEEMEQLLGFEGLAHY
jgi:hypothetical protein